jgi:catechol 2,3-dioxygenase-like lactoylglutathione lyase family enzyme
MDMDIGQNATPVAFLYVSDRERALDFYRDMLGVELRSSDGFGDFLDLGGAMLRMTVIPDHQPHAHPVLGWNVDDIAAAAKALRDKGIEFAIYQGMGQDALGIWTSPDGKSKVAFFADPDGNVLTLAQA